MGQFEIREDFYLNEEVYKVISGSIHYFRVVPQYWEDRLQKLKAMGCNTVETYVPWNLHERKKGVFDFTGILDVVAFIQLAQKLGLYVIVRPSPYICAEWEFGGLPAWLLKEDGMRVRSMHPSYIQHVRDYYEVLIPMLSPLQIIQGGPVIMMQIENEYGYFGDDTYYLETLRQYMLELGVNVPLVTSDGPWGDALVCGKVAGALQTANFGSKAAEQFEVLRREGAKPLMCMEFWVGWFDHWGCGKHQTTKVDDCAKELDKILELGHVNIYMFQGGTNFGFMNGSNYYGELKPDVTSYDYDALLTEDGQLTEKYSAFKEVIMRHTGIETEDYQSGIIRKSYGSVVFNQKVSLESIMMQLGDKYTSLYPLSMEKVDQEYGYILYRSVLKKEKQLEKIQLYGANDRAIIMLNGRIVATLYDTELLSEYVWDSPIALEEDSMLEILVENMGRVNFSHMLNKQRKGIDGGVLINGHEHSGWEIFSLPLDEGMDIDFSKAYKAHTPAFYQGTFQVDEIGDTFIDVEGWGKGCIFINGFNIGRFWEIGPQKRLYIPGPLLRLGENVVMVFETEGKVKETMMLDSLPKLG